MNKNGIGVVVGNQGRGGVMAQLSLACIALSRSQRELLLSLRVAYKHEKKKHTFYCMVQSRAGGLRGDGCVRTGRTPERNDI